MTPLRRLRPISVLLLLVFGMLSAAAQDLYWEEPRYVVSQGALFSEALAADDFMITLWQEKDPSGDDSAVSLSLAVSENGVNWEENRRFLGPFPFTGGEIPFYSAVLSPDGTLRLAVSEPDNRIHLYISRDRGESFQELSVTPSLPVRVMPRFFRTADGGYLLFATQTQSTGVANSLGISYAYSAEGAVWSDFQPLAADEGFRGTFLPRHVSHRGREYVFYQAFHLANISTFQLYMKSSGDGEGPGALRSIFRASPIPPMEWGMIPSSTITSAPIRRSWEIGWWLPGNGIWRGSRVRYSTGNSAPTAPSPTGPNGFPGEGISVGIPGW